MSFRTIVQKLRIPRVRTPKPAQEHLRKRAARFKQVIRDPKVSTMIGKYLGKFDSLYKKEWLAIQPSLKKAEILLANPKLSPSQRRELAKSQKTVMAFYKRTSKQFESREIEVGDSIIELKFTPINGILTIRPQKIDGEWVRAGAYQIDMASHNRTPRLITK
jgi:hypothetical protein